MSNAETDLLLALRDCEAADLQEPAERVVHFVAREFNVDADALLDLWLRKWLAVADAKDAIARERTGDA